MTTEQKAEQTTLTSARIPTSTLKALQRRAKRLNISQNKLIIVLLNQGLGLGDEDFNVNPPLPTDEAIANLQARLEVVEKQLGIEAIEPFVSEPIKSEEPLPLLEELERKSGDRLLSKTEAVDLAIERDPKGLGTPKVTPAAKRFSNAYTDYANGKVRGNPEDKWGIRRIVNPNGKDYLYQDLRKG